MASSPSTHIPPLQRAPRGARREAPWPVPRRWPSVPGSDLDTGRRTRPSSSCKPILSRPNPLTRSWLTLFFLPLQRRIRLRKVDHPGSPPHCPAQQVLHALVHQGVVGRVRLRHPNNDQDRDHPDGLQGWPVLRAAVRHCHDHQPRSDRRKAHRPPIGEEPYHRHPHWRA